MRQETQVVQDILAANLLNKKWPSTLQFLNGVNCDHRGRKKLRECEREIRYWCAKKSLKIVIEIFFIARALPDCT